MEGARASKPGSSESSPDRNPESAPDAGGALAEEIRVETADGLRLIAHLSRGPVRPARLRPPALILCHGFPVSREQQDTQGLSTYPQFADRLAGETGWTVLTFAFRGTGGSPGEFSMAGWIQDARAAVEVLHDRGDVGAVFMAGSSVGGAVALCVAADDDRVQGVATLAAPADLRPWIRDAQAFLDHCRSIGIVRDHRVDGGTVDPIDPIAFGAEVAELDVLGAARRLPPRPLLVMHGTADDVVPVDDARALAEAAGPATELRIVYGGSHRLRHDPRAVATLLGWLTRHGPGSPSPVFDQEFADESRRTLIDHFEVADDDLIDDD